MGKIMGLTADECNYKAENGYLNEQDLQDFCTVQNKLVCSIQYKVVS